MSTRGDRGQSTTGQDCGDLIGTVPCTPERLSSLYSFLEPSSIGCYPVLVPTRIERIYRIEDRACAGGYYGYDCAGRYDPETLSKR